MNLKNNYKKYITVTLTCVFIYALFFFISYCSPLCGDDWAFYDHWINGGIIGPAISMYNTWEARLFTLINMHAIVGHKMLWNMLNPAFYVVIYLCVMKIIKPKNIITSSLMFIFIMTSIKDEVRMETYSWVTGSIYYVLPLVVSFLGLTELFKYLDEKDYKPRLFRFVLMVLCFTYVPLGMENIGATMLFAVLFVFGYRLFKFKEIDKRLLLTLFFMAISYVVWMMSPGTAVREATMTVWNNLTLIEKIMDNLPRVINYTFIDNKYLMFALCIVMACYDVFKTKFNNYIKCLFLIIYVVAAFDLLSENILNITHIEFLSVLATKGTLFNNVFWLLFTIAYLSNLIMVFVENDNSLNAMIFGLLGACAAAILFISPVVGPRLQIYTIYFVGSSVIAILDKLIDSKYISFTVIAILLTLSLLKTKTLLYKYKLVKDIQAERQTEIYYYHLYRENEDSYLDGKLWLPRFPIYTVHGGDIEIDDQYHMEYFKKYYDISNDVEPTFYFKDEY